MMSLFLDKSSEVDVFFPEWRVEDRHQEYGHTCSHSTGLAVFLVVEEHRVSSVNVQDRDGRFQDAHHLCLPVTAKD